MIITKEKWKLILKLLIAIATAIGGTLGVQSCNLF
jgi:hypothetical protein